MNLFGTQKEPTCQIKAGIKYCIKTIGKCTYENHLVTPDPRKGLLFLDSQDGLLHLFWKDRTTQQIEEDLIIFPDEAEFRQVNSLRVYVLFFKSSAQRLFFWIQEPHDNDKTVFAKFNKIMNNSSGYVTLQRFTVEWTKALYLKQLLNWIN